MIQKEKIKDYFCDNWKVVVDRMKEGLILVDVQGNILYANKALEELLLFDMEELLGQPCNILECDACFGENLMREGKRCALFQKGQIHDLHCSFKQKNGDRIQVIKNAIVLTDNNGAVVAGLETLTDLTAVVNKENVISALRKQLNLENEFYGLIGNSHVMTQVHELIKSVAQVRGPVIIYGESGTGKELVANAIHKLSTPTGAPFIKINCAALNEVMLENELFRHGKGTVIEAEPVKPRPFEDEVKGSIFLDEIGDLPLTTQNKLLHILEEQGMKRVAGHQSLPLPFRIISATNKNFDLLLIENRFRGDLYSRLRALPIKLPPLRKRPEDIPLLVETFINRFRLKTGKDITSISKNGLDLLLSYSWPGNIRELINVIEYAFVICPQGEITPKHLPQQFQTSSGDVHATTQSQSPADRRQQLLHVLNKTNGNKSEAARILGISRVTLWKQLKRYNITVDKSAY
ncbi:MAG: sigma 54-interacting transcriptional regulator [Proteobacteria bacterium]|nr:sigma 54-interacting transcriptional regulator [Pseudomonadota bacterium]MBU1059320.1 sigma 54-interacting transcriptional regulator [Pseudomonadota bacterium]